MIIRMALTLVALAALLFPGEGYADDFPVSVAASSIDGSPKVKAKQLSQGAQQWDAHWPPDSQGRQLHVSYIRAPGGIPSRNFTANQLFAIVFAEGLGPDQAEADARQGGSGQGKLWGMTASWAFGSELAERNPLQSDTESNEGGKAPRGPERRYCAMFVGYEADGKGALSGAYCKVMPEGSEVSDADALGWLAALDLEVE